MLIVLLVSWLPMSWGIRGLRLPLHILAARGIVRMKLARPKPLKKCDERAVPVFRRGRFEKLITLDYCGAVQCPGSGPAALRSMRNAGLFEQDYRFGIGSNGRHPLERGVEHDAMVAKLQRAVLDVSPISSPHSKCPLHPLPVAAALQSPDLRAC